MTSSNHPVSRSLWTLTHRVNTIAHERLTSLSLAALLGILAVSPAAPLMGVRPVMAADDEAIADVVDLEANAEVEAETTDESVEVFPFGEQLPNEPDASEIPEAPENPDSPETIDNPELPGASTPGVDPIPPIAPIVEPIAEPAPEPEPIFQRKVEPRIQLDLSDRRLSLFADDELIGSYTVAVGKPGWETPTGDYAITHMALDPIWENPWTGELIYPGGNNPMGRAVIVFHTIGDDMIAFHGTPNEGLLGQAVSHGCVRMRNEDILAMYEVVRYGTPVTVVP